MTVKEELQEIRQIDLLIKSKLEEISTFRSLAEKVTSTLSNEPRGGGISDKTGDNVIRIVTIENEINDLIDILINKKTEAMSRITQIKETDRRVVLSLRYIAHQTWEQIACKLNVTAQWVHVLHGRALQDYEKLR